MFCPHVFCHPRRVNHRPLSTLSWLNTKPVDPQAKSLTSNHGGRSHQRMRPLATQQQPVDHDGTYHTIPSNHNGRYPTTSSSLQTMIVGTIPYHPTMMVGSTIQPSNISATLIIYNDGCMYHQTIQRQRYTYNLMVPEWSHCAGDNIPSITSSADGIRWHLTNPLSNAKSFLKIGDITPLQSCKLNSHNSSESGSTTVSEKSI